MHVPCPGWLQLPGVVAQHAFNDVPLDILEIYGDAVVGEEPVEVVCVFSPPARSGFLKVHIVKVQIMEAELATAQLQLPPRAAGGQGHQQRRPLAVDVQHRGPQSAIVRPVLRSAAWRKRP